MGMELALKMEVKVRVGKGGEKQRSTAQNDGL
jgi:hypothetical protein